MIKAGAIEDSGVIDSADGGVIKVSTTARITYRKLNPTWGKARNDELNKVIADQFSRAEIKSIFKPKANIKAKGEIREGGGSKFIALAFSDQIWVIAVKGNPTISHPAAVNLEQNTRDMWQRSHRGYLENHFFDLFDGMYALDSQSRRALMYAARETDNPIKYMKDLHQKGKDAVVGAAATILAEMSVRQLNMGPESNPDSHRIFSVPLGVPI